MPLEPRLAGKLVFAGKTFVLTGTLPKRSRAEAEALDQGARRQDQRFGLEGDELRAGRRRCRQQARESQAAWHPDHRRGGIRADGGVVDRPCRERRSELRRRSGEPTRQEFGAHRETPLRRRRGLIR